MTKEGTSVSGLLDRVRSGDRSALNTLIPIVYTELRRLAAHYMRREYRAHSLQTTALMHEAYIRLASQDEWHHREHFFAIAAEVMRNILVDHARARLAAKRGAQGTRISLDEVPVLSPARCADLLALDEALTRLAAIDPRQARIVVLRYFAGMTMPEAASVLGISDRTALRGWNLAKAWLYAELRRKQRPSLQGCKRP